MEEFKAFFKINKIFVSSEILPLLAASAVVSLLLWLLRHMIMRFVWHKVEDIHVRYRTKKITNFTIVIIGVLILGRIWIQGFQSITTFLGLLSAGIAIALKDTITNLAGWLFILGRRPFTIGDRLQIGAHAGDVIDIRLFQFTILEISNWVDEEQSTGRIIHIPNSQVLTIPIANYSKGFQYIWNEIPVLITFESNWEKAKEILTQIINKHSEHLTHTAQKKLREASKDFLIFYSKLTPIVYTSVKDSGVLLTIRHLCEPRYRRNMKQSIWEDILRTFAHCNDIDFAYPTQRFFNHKIEGPPPEKTDK